MNRYRTGVQVELTYPNSNFKHRTWTGVSAASAVRLCAVLLARGWTIGNRGGWANTQWVYFNDPRGSELGGMRQRDD